MLSIRQKTGYLLYKVFLEVNPKPEDLFGAIEVCAFLEEHYQLGGRADAAVGYINANITSSGAKLNAFGFLKSDTHIDTADGRAVSYATAHVQPQFERWEQTDAIFRTAKPIYDANPTQYVQECLDYAITESARTDLHGKMGDCNFSMDEIKKAREKYLSAVTDKQKQKQLDSVDVIANADCSVSASETGCIPDVKCPKCGKKYVQFIDADSQTGVNSLRNRRDKRKGRTMCCAACGYKW